MASADVRITTAREPEPTREIRRVGFVSTRIAGTDGVSLEIAKWTEILEKLGFECYFIAGECDRAPDRTFIIDQAHFQHPLIREINDKCFGRTHRIRQMSDLIQGTARSIKSQLYEAFDKFDLQSVIAENALTIPMNIPLGAALQETLLERQLECIVHHHDFVWERDRFLINAVEDYLAAVFPPRLSHHMQHVVINSLAGAEFGRRTGLPYRVIPNVMNFEQPPAAAHEDADDFREQIGIRPDELLILQPTRVVQRKGIEHSIELVRRLAPRKCKLVITHSYHDEGSEEYERVRQFAELMNVDVIFAEPWIHHGRTTNADGRKRYSMWDAYRHADLVTYPSIYEGFGNAFLEAIYFRKPILCNRYTIFRTDIEPFGFRTVLMDGAITEQVVSDVLQLLDNADLREEMAEHNYRVARQNFSYARVENEFRVLFSCLQSGALCDS